LGGRDTLYDWNDRQGLDRSDRNEQELLAQLHYAESSIKGRRREEEILMRKNSYLRDEIYQDQRHSTANFGSSKMRSTQSESEVVSTRSRKHRCQLNIGGHED